MDGLAPEGRPSAPLAGDAGQGAEPAGAGPPAAPDGYGHRIYRSAVTPWVVLTLGIAVSVGLYANAIRQRNTDLAAANRDTITETRATTRMIIEGAGREARSAARAAFPLGRPSETALREYVVAHRVALQNNGASGIAMLTPQGAGSFDFFYAEAGGLSTKGTVALAPLGVDERTLADTRASPIIGLTNIFQGDTASTGGIKTHILATLTRATGPGGTFAGWTGALLNPELIAGEVVTRVPRLHGLSITDRADGSDVAFVTDAGTLSPGARGIGALERVTMTVFGRPLTLTMRVSAATESPELTKARNLLLGMLLLVTLLLFAIAQLVRRNERRGAAMVDTATRSLTRSEERFRALVNEQNDVVLVIDRAVNIKWASPAATRVLGYPLDEFVGRNGLDLVDEEDRSRSVEVLAQLLDPTRENVDPLELRVLHADGHIVHMEVQGTDLSDEPAVDGIVVNLRDLSDRREIEEELAEAQARFQVAFEHASIGISMASADGVILRANQAFADMLGRSPAELSGMRSRTITHPDDVHASDDELHRLAIGEISSYQLEKRYFHADGHLVWGSVNVSGVRDAAGEVRYVIAQIEDVTEKKAIAARLAHQAIHDPMTGLPNRAVFLDRLRVALEAANQKGTRVGLIFCDLDHFKWINDSYGHATGDQVLAAVGDRLRTVLRPTDSIARFGGDEFTILCADLSEERALLVVADRIHETISAPFQLPDGDAFVTISLGAALSDAETTTPEALLRNADTAMYRAKTAGRARTEVFDVDAQTSTVASLRTGNALHHALDRGEFRVFYQPVVDLVTGDVLGVESLVRWEHPERGIVEPSEFVPLAEETGLIVPIGRFVLEEACRQAVEWQHNQGPDEPKLTVSVNLSPRQLAEPSLAHEVAAIIHHSGIDPDSLWLEITESTLMHDAESAISALQALRAQGLHLAVDDFGTGYSSLLYLKRFPVEALKVDRSFVDGLGRSPEDTAIVSAVVSLAHAMRLLCVAEGVESVDQLRDLQALGCDLGQGYLFDRPRSAAAHGRFPSHDLPAWSTPVLGARNSA